VQCFIADTYVTHITIVIRKTREPKLPVETAVKGKGKVHPITGHEGPEGEQRYSSTLSLTSKVDGGGGQRHAPSVLPSGKTRYPLYRRLGGPQGRSG
jgi:hypothetical protein